MSRQIIGSGHPSTSTHPSEGVYANDTLYYRNGHQVNRSTSLIEKEEYLTVYFQVENDDASMDTPESNSASQVSSQIHSRLQSAQLNCNLNRHHGNHLSVLRRNHQQERRHTQNHHQEELFCGNTVTGDDPSASATAASATGYDISRSSGCKKQFQRQDQNRHSHQSYFTHCQISNDSSPPSLLYPGSPFTPSSSKNRYSGERSRIKTNPWLRSPWMTPQRKSSFDQCPSSSSVSGSNGNSSDSGCSLIPSSNALANSCETGRGTDTKTQDTTCDSIGMVTTPSSSISSANTSPTTDEEALHSTIGIICPTVNGSASKSIKGASSTLKCDINKNRLPDHLTTNNTSSGKRILNHRSSCDMSRLYPCSPRRNSSSGSLSSNNNNNNNNSGYICNGVVRRSKDQFFSKNGSNSNVTTDSVLGGCTTSSRISCTAAFRTSNCGSTLGAAGGGGNNSSNSSSCSRRRKRRSRVQSTANCSGGNRISLLTSIVNANNPTSTSSTCTSSASSNSSSPNEKTSDHLNTCKGVGSIRRRKGKVVINQISTSSTCSSTSSLSQLPAPPDSASSQIILQDILTNLVTSSKNGSGLKEERTGSHNTSPLEGTVKKKMQVKGDSLDEKNKNKKKSQIESSNKGDSYDVVVGKINSRVDERTTRQEASCLFSDVILLHSNCQGSNNNCGNGNSNNIAASNLSKRNNERQVVEDAAAAAATTNAHPPPPSSRNLDVEEIEGTYHKKNYIRQLRSPCRADTLRATYKDESTEHKEDESRNIKLALGKRECETEQKKRKDEKEEEKGKSESPKCLGGNIDATSNPPSECISNCNATGSTSASSCTSISMVKLRRNVNNCSTQYQNSNRQSAPVFVDVTSSKELVTSPMATSMIAMGSGECDHLPSGVYTGSSDCFTITPSSSRGSSVSFSRSSSMSSSRPGSLVSGSAALSAAGRRYYSSLLNKRRFVPTSIEQMNHQSLGLGSSSNSLFKRLSAMSNEEWVSTATEELICSDEEDEETEYESETSQVDVNVMGEGRICEFASKKVLPLVERQLTYPSIPVNSETKYNEEVIASGKESFTCSGDEDDEVSVTPRSKEEKEGEEEKSSKGVNGNGQAVSLMPDTMSHDSEITTCGQEELASTVAAVTASAVLRRRKESAPSNESCTLSYMKNRGGGSYIRVQSTSSNCTSSGSSSSPAGATATSSILNPCLVYNCKIGVSGNSNSLRRVNGRKNESTTLLSSVCKEDIQARGLFEARHLREMRKETKATLMQVNENIDSTFSPLQQLKLVSERLEQLLKMEEETNGTNTLTLFVHGKDERKKENEQNRDYTNGQNGCSDVTQSTTSTTKTLKEEKEKGNPTPTCHQARDLPTRNSPLPQSDTCQVQMVLTPDLSNGKCDSVFSSSGHTSKSPNLLHLSPLTPETPMTEDSGVEVSCSSSLTPSGDSNASISSCQVISTPSSCVTDTVPKGFTSFDSATVNSSSVTRSVDTSDSPLDVTNTSTSSLNQITSTSNSTYFPPQSGSNSTGLCKRNVSSSSTSKFDRRIRRTLEHEKLWQEIANRLSLNETEKNQSNGVASFLDSFLTNSSRQNCDASLTTSSSDSSSSSSSSQACSSYSSSLPPVNQT